MLQNAPCSVYCLTSGAPFFSSGSRFPRFLWAHLSLSVLGSFFPSSSLHSRRHRPFVASFCLCRSSFPLSSSSHPYASLAVWKGGDTRVSQRQSIGVLQATVRRATYRHDMPRTGDPGRMGNREEEDHGSVMWREQVEIGVRMRGARWVGLVRVRVFALGLTAIPLQKGMKSGHLVSRERGQNMIDPLVSSFPCHSSARTLRLSPFLILSLLLLSYLFLPTHPRVPLSTPSLRPPSSLRLLESCRMSSSP